MQQSIEFGVAFEIGYKNARTSDGLVPQQQRVTFGGDCYLERL